MVRLISHDKPSKHTQADVLPHTAIIGNLRTAAMVSRDASIDSCEYYLLENQHSGLGN